MQKTIDCGEAMNDESQAALTVGLPPSINLPPGADGYEAGKFNNIHGHPGGDGYIGDITGPSGPKTVAKMGNASIRGGYG